MKDPHRSSRTLLQVKFIPRPRCENCRSRPAVVTLTRKHVTMDFDANDQAELIGTYDRTEDLCQPCANEVVREESMFLDSVIDDGKPMFIQSQDCIHDDEISEEDCGCRNCLDELEIDELTSDPTPR